MSLSVQHNYLDWSSEKKDGDPWQQCDFMFEADGSLEIGMIKQWPNADSTYNIRIPPEEVADFVVALQAWIEQLGTDPDEYRKGDRIVDMEGDLATVHDIRDDGRLVIEWDCNPGKQVTPHSSYRAHLTNLSAVERGGDG